MESDKQNASADFAAMKYAELQKHAKRVGIKANTGHKKLVAALVKYYSEKEKENQHIQETSQGEKSETVHSELPSRVSEVKNATLSSSPVTDKKAKARPQTPVRTPVLNCKKGAGKLTPVNSPINSKIHTPIRSSAVTGISTSGTKSGRQTPKTPVFSPCVKGKQTPVQKVRQQAAKQSPILSKAATPDPQAVKNTAGAIEPTTDDKNIPLSKKLSSSGKRKASLISSDSPASSPAAKKRRRSTFEIPPSEDPAIQDGTNQETSGSPQTKEMIGALKPEMSNEEMKNTLLSAIDKKVQAKCQTESASKATSSIPRFAAFLAKKREAQPSTPGSSKKPITPGNKDWAKIHKKNFDKFDSIDVYLNKKKQRAEEITASVKKAKNILAEVQASVNKLKSHKTPTTENLMKKPRRSSDAKKTAPFKPSVLNLSEANFNFGGMKSPKTVPRKSPKTLPRKSPKAVITASAKKMVATPQPSALNRKSTGINSVTQPLSKTTPFRFTATLNTTVNSTLNTTQSVKKNAFDLQASLSKPLTWVPHKGKLKPFGEQRSPSYKKPGIGQSVGKSRDVRRADAAQRRADKKCDQRMARRGIKV